MTMDAIIRFAKKQGYDTVARLEPWNGFDVYEPLFEGEDDAIVGLPLVILVKGDEIRMSTPEESMQTIADAED